MNETMGQIIRRLRKERNLTQEELAELLDVSRQAVSKWEMGASYPDMTMIPTLAFLFKVSLDELFDFDVKKATASAVAFKIKQIITWTVLLPEQQAHHT